MSQVPGWVLWGLLNGKVNRCSRHKHYMMQRLRVDYITKWQVHLWATDGHFREGNDILLFKRLLEGQFIWQPLMDVIGRSWFSTRWHWSTPMRLTKHACGRSKMIFPQITHLEPKAFHERRWHYPQGQWPRWHQRRRKRSTFVVTLISTRHKDGNPALPHSSPMVLCFPTGTEGCSQMITG